MYRYETAYKIAQRLVEILTPVCARVDIAGSIRRMKHEVKDIEILCIPRTVQKQKTDELFSETETVICPEFEATMNQFTQQVIKGRIGGRYMKIVLKGGMPLDLFMPVPVDYFRQLAIRTGSAEFVQKYISGGWNRIGWCGVKDQGLRLQAECTCREGSDGKLVWSCSHPNPTIPPGWESEESFFTWLGLTYTPPECRESNTILNLSL